MTREVGRCRTRRGDSGLECGRGLRVTAAKGVRRHVDATTRCGRDGGDGEVVEEINDG